MKHYIIKHPQFCSSCGRTLNFLKDTNPGEGTGGDLLLDFNSHSITSRPLLSKCFDPFFFLSGVGLQGQRGLWPTLQVATRRPSRGFGFTVGEPPSCPSFLYSVWFWVYPGVSSQLDVPWRLQLFPYDAKEELLRCELPFLKLDAIFTLMTMECTNQNLCSPFSSHRYTQTQDLPPFFKRGGAMVHPVWHRKRT